MRIRFSKLDLARVAWCFIYECNDFILSVSQRSHYFKVKRVKRGKKSVLCTLADDSLNLLSEHVYHKNCILWKRWGEKSLSASHRNGKFCITFCSVDANFYDRPSVVQAIHWTSRMLTTGYGVEITTFGNSRRWNVTEMDIAVSDTIMRQRTNWTLRLNEIELATFSNCQIFFAHFIPSKKLLNNFFPTFYASLPWADR